MKITLLSKTVNRLTAISFKITVSVTEKETQHAHSRTEIQKIPESNPEQNNHPESITTSPGTLHSHRNRTTRFCTETDMRSTARAGGTAT